MVIAGTQKLVEEYKAIKAELESNDTYTQVCVCVYVCVYLILVIYIAWEFGKKVATPRTKQLCNERLYPYQL